MKPYERMIGSDSQTITCGNVTKNQYPVMKLIRNYIINFLHWIQDLAQQPPNSFIGVFIVRLDLIL